MLGFYTEEAGGTQRTPGTPDGPKHLVVADLLALAVLPTYQRKGIGTKLLDHVIDVAERVAPASNITQLRLTVAEHNVGAQRLYARNGFHIVEGAATYDRGQRALRMVRNLGATTS
jgi:ribosomal protein S18 acetylase RimI-like enzyme